MNLPQPPERSYASLDEAFNDINAWASSHGYGVAKERSILDKHGNTRKVWLFC